MRIGPPLAATGALGISAIGYGLLEANSFTLRRVDVPILPEGAPSIRVLHMSDIHLMPYQRHKLEWLAGLAALEPDLVVNTGDNMGSPDSMDPLISAWGRLLDRPGVFIFGSNDYFAPRFLNPLSYLTRSGKLTREPHRELPWRDLRDRMTRRGWIDLTHRRAQLKLAGSTIELRGTDDAHIDRDNYQRVAGPGAPEADLCIGVTHAPYLRILDAMTADGLDLILAGHTHGGQVCAPGFGALVTNCDLDTARAKGLSWHQFDGRRTHLHVSAGVGASPFVPLRVACRPEATLLTLTAAN